MVAGIVAASMALSFLFALPLLLAVVSVAGLGSGEELRGEPAVIFFAILFQDILLVGLVYLLLVRRGTLSWRQMGLTGPRSPYFVLRGLGWGLLFILVAAVVQTVLASFGVEQNQAELFPVEDAGFWGRAAILVAGVLLAPLAEEIFFRGYLFRAITARKGLLKGVAFSSALFGLIHLNLGAFLPIAAGSAVLAVAYHRSGDLWVPITAHAFNNALAFGLLLLVET
jgi:membrane protease YdiL (CAAX protease family)